MEEALTVTFKETEKKSPTSLSRTLSELSVFWKMFPRPLGTLNCGNLTASFFLSTAICLTRNSFSQGFSGHCFSSDNNTVYRMYPWGPTFLCQLYTSLHVHIANTCQVAADEHVRVLWDWDKWDSQYYEATNPQSGPVGKMLATQTRIPRFGSPAPMLSGGWGIVVRHTGIPALRRPRQSSPGAWWRASQSGYGAPGSMKTLSRE